ncbi:hypothetical protein C791_0595 [Amycolatopsis azurea DSM 43854]|uniref:Uncharacterized protein n=1 Tax=Amycolatopsis azurea DSM 43854 TaxID=1238180 RepID=M2NIP7_9PSEU|nr:hypothetical protein C791_0595 [Amycolatopsis azurea DSM 43854]
MRHADILTHRRPLGRVDVWNRPPGSGPRWRDRRGSKGPLLSPCA